MELNLAHSEAVMPNGPILDGVMSDGAWYALYTRHQHERAVVGSVTRRGIEAFLPLHNTYSRWSDRVKTIQRPLFPCYVFVRMEARWHSTVLQTPGVHFIVGNSVGPCPIPGEEIAAIARSLHNKILLEPWPFLTAGDRVRIKTGPMEGVEGILIRKKNNDRLVLSVGLLQRSVALEIDGYLLERIGK
jgi:transcription antitermination factor NusG